MTDVTNDDGARSRKQNKTLSNDRRVGGHTGRRTRRRRRGRILRTTVYCNQYSVFRVQANQYKNYFKDFSKSFVLKDSFHDYHDFKIKLLVREKKSVYLLLI